MPRSMFTIGTLGVGALVVVAVIPAFAGASRATPTVADERSVGPPTHEFEALSSLPDARRVGLTVMSEEELAAVEGAVFPCVVCVNAAKIREALVANLRQTLARLAAPVGKPRQASAARGLPDVAARGASA